MDRIARRQRARQILRLDLENDEARSDHGLMQLLGGTPDALDIGYFFDIGKAAGVGDLRHLRGLRAAHQEVWRSRHTLYPHGSGSCGAKFTAPSRRLGSRRSAGRRFRRCKSKAAVGPEQSRSAALPDPGRHAVSDATSVT